MRQPQPPIERKNTMPNSPDPAPNTFAPAALVHQLRWRYGVKVFDPDRTLTDPEEEAILESLRLAPSSFGLQPWTFIRVESREMRETLAEVAPHNRAKIMDCSMLLVLARMRSIPSDYVDRYFDAMCEARGVSREDISAFSTMVSGSVASMTPDAIDAWTARQLYVALGSAVTTAAAIGIDACPMEGIDPAAFDKALSLDGTLYASTVGLAVGHRSPSDPYASLAKVRFERDQVFQTI